MNGLVTEVESGLMQFEITNDWQGRPTPGEFRPCVIVVHPPEIFMHKTMKHDCPHTRGYRMVEDSLPVNFPYTGEGSLVCECVGRLIE